MRDYILCLGFSEKEYYFLQIISNAIIIIIKDKKVTRTRKEKSKEISQKCVLENIELEFTYW